MSQTFSRVYKSALDNPKDNRFYKIAGFGEVSNFKEHRAMVTTTDIADIKSVTVLQEVLGLSRPQYTLVNACRVMPTDSLEFNVDVATKLAAEEKVPDLVEAELSKQGYSRVSFDLWKNVVHVAVSGKAGRQAAHNVMQLSIQDAAGALAYSKNGQIKTALEGSSRTGAGGNWKSTDNPYDDLMTAINSVEGTYGFKPNVVCAPPLVWSAFWGNAYVKGSLNGQVMPAGPVFQVPGLPGFTGISDWSLTAASATVLDSRSAVVLAQGPVEAEAYRNAGADFDAWVIRDWMEPKLVCNDAAYTITAVLS